MRAAWFSDIHLNFLSPGGVSAFFNSLDATGADALLISGDIAEAPHLHDLLVRMADSFSGQIYFVLGNHDFYFGSIERTRAQMHMLCKEEPKLVYLTNERRPITLTPGVGIIGHDGWGDAQYGDYACSQVMMNDYYLIEELAAFTKEDRLPVLRELGRQAASHVRKLLTLALEGHEHVVLLTHLPPLREACWYQGNYSDNEWIPHFTCKAIGDTLLEVMAAAPARRLTVLCGHTHSPGVCRPLENVEIVTAAAEYGSPRLQQVFEFA